MSTSLKHAAFELDNGYPFKSFQANGDEVFIHRFYPLREFPGKHSLSASTSIAVIRDPLERFVSLYRHRVIMRRVQTKGQFERAVELGLPRDPSLEQFAELLQFYRNAVPDIAHHGAPQSYFLGATLDQFDYTFSTSNSGGLASLLTNMAGRNVEFQELNKTKVVGTLDIPPRVCTLIREYYEADYTLIGNRI